MGWHNPDDEEFPAEVRIILASAEFSTELTTSVLWLREHDIDIRCVRLKPYSLEPKRVLIDVQEVIPLPQATQYQIQVQEKEKEKREKQRRVKVGKMAGIREQAVKKLRESPREGMEQRELRKQLAKETGVHLLFSEK